MKKQRKIAEDFVPSITTNNDSAVMVRNAIKTCWDNIDTYSMLSQQLSEFGCQFAKSSFDTLINDLYITVGALEEVLNTYDPKAAAIEAPAEVTALNAVAPQVVQQMAQPTIIATPVLEKFTLDEGNSLNEEVEEKSEMQKKLEKPVEKDLKEVEKYRKEKVKDSQNPDPEEIDESLDDESLDPHFYESLLKLED